MAEHLFVRVEDGSDQATVVALSDQGHLLGGPDQLPLDSVAERVNGMQVTVLLPGSAIVSSVADVPAVSASRVRQMLPFALEDEFAGDVDALHFAAGARNAAGDLRVSVIDRAQFERWLARLHEAGLSPRRICSETDGVPDTPGSVTLFIETGRISGRRPNGAAFVFDGLGLDELWALLAAETEDGTDLDNVVAFVDSASRESRSAEIEQWRQEVANLNLKELAEGCLPKLASGLVFETGANLLQGDFAPRSSVRALARPWKAAAGFVIAFILISALGKGLEIVKLGRDEARLSAEATAICQRNYGSAQLPACLLEMGRRLASTGQSASSGSGGFLALLTAVSQSIDPVMKVRNLSYRDDSLMLEINTPNASYLDAFDQRLGERGQFAVAPQNTQNESDGSLTVRLRIAEASL